MTVKATFGYSEMVGAALSSALMDEQRTEFTCEVCLALCDACAAMTRHSLALGLIQPAPVEELLAIYANLRASIEQARALPPESRGAILEHARGALVEELVRTYRKWGPGPTDDLTDEQREVVEQVLAAGDSDANTPPRRD